MVLARIIPDEEQALSSAAGIKLLVDLLQDSNTNETIALACDCIARLAHTRAGIIYRNCISQICLLHIEMYHHKIDAEILGYFFSLLIYF